MSANPSALVRLWEEFEAHEDDAVLGGIYANKGGYHNTRANHLRDRPSDYSIQAPADKRGPSDKAAALDITFNTARMSDFRIIDKYSSRLLTAFRNRDSRLFHNGAAVWREFFGNADLDREVEGWSLYRGYAVSSDDSHLWHIHLSCHREFVENWDAVKGILDVLLDRDSQPEPPPKEWDELASKEELREVFAEELDKKVGAIAKAVWYCVNENTGRTYGYLVRKLATSGGLAIKSLVSGNQITPFTALRNAQQKATTVRDMLSAMQPLVEAAAAGKALTLEDVAKIATAVQAAVGEGLADEIVDEVADRLVGGADPK